MKKYTIEDLADGKCAVINDGTLDELKEVLSKAFNNNREVIGAYRYYESRLFSNWISLDTTSLPTQSVKDFLEEEEQNKKVCLRADNTDKTGKRIIKYLKSLGGVNIDRYGGVNKGMFYFVTKQGKIDFENYIPEGYVLIELPTEEDNFVLPEKWCVQRNNDNCTILNEWANNQTGVSGTDSNDGWLHNTNFGLYGRENGGIDGHYYINYDKVEGHTEITFEQFKKYVLNEQKSAKEKQTTMRKIKSSQAQDIINIACNTWKANLAEKWAKEIVLKKEIEITEDFYQEMRKACTKEQNELFDKIFGIESPYKEGELIFVRDRKEDLWKLAIFLRMFGSDRSVTCKCSYTSDSVSVWKYHAPAKGVVLPE